MAYPDIKTFHENWRDHKIMPLSGRPNFLGQDALDVRWSRTRFPVNIKRNGKIFEMEVAIPGFKKQELKISVEGDVLTIQAMKSKERKSGSDYVLQEFNVDLMERQFKLGKGIGKEKIQAKYQNGILKLTFIDVPVKEEQEFKRIEVE